MPNSRGHGFPSHALQWLLGFFVAAMLAMGVTLGSATTIDDLARGFPRPPGPAKPFLWWHWMNGNVSREGIVRDLQAFHDAGFGGVILFEEADRIPEGPVHILSPEHLDLIAFASAECARLGLEFGFQNCPGWSSSGGPWITPEQAMKHLTWSEQTVTGGKRLSIHLARPSTRVRPLEEVGPPGRYLEGLDYYQDVKVLAFPTPAAPDWRMDSWKEKAGFRTARNLQEQAGPAPEGAAIDPAKILDLSGRLQSDGSLDWDAPAGNWTILRFGYTLTAHANREAPTVGGRGLECDKLSRDAVEFHWDHFVAKLLKAARREPGAGASTVMVDSYEALTQTWTPRMAVEFQRLRNYDLTRFLPCLTGRVVGDLRESERFLWDYRRTMADLVAENFYGTLSGKCREEGLALAIEGYGYYGTFFDDFANNMHSDIPSGEFWSGVVKWHHWSGKIAASAADIKGTHLVGAEAFTAGNDMAAWKWHPYTLKAQGDYFLCRGINRFYIQAGAHQPWADHIRPGMTLGPHGIQMNRHNTWFTPSRAWLAYQARAQFMLQHGQLVADYYVDYGNNSPATVRPAARVTAKGPKGVDWDVDADVSPEVGFTLPGGRDFHVGNSSVLHEFRVNSDDQLELPSGQAYSVLVLPHDERMQASVLEQVVRLVEAGATVVGPRPDRSPSLVDLGSADTAFAKLAERAWGGSARRVLDGISLEKVFQGMGLAPDFEFRAIASASGVKQPVIDYVHRRVGDGEFYFISNQRNEPAGVECVLRASGRNPELWHPESGDIRPLPVWRTLEDGRTAVQLNLEPAESCFIVFRDDARRTLPQVTSFTRDGSTITDGAVARLEANGRCWSVDAFKPGWFAAMTSEGNMRANVPSLPEARDLSADWNVRFPDGTGAPANITLPRLGSLSDHETDGVKYFSGTASYSKTFEISDDELAPGRRVALSLGNVQVIAELSVNGRGAGILWKPPFRCDVTSMLRPGINTLEVKVTNLWRNRLIGDAFVRNFTAADAARVADRMLSGDTSSREATGRTASGATDEPYPLPGWVRNGEPNPDAGTYTFTIFPFINTSTPLPPSGLVGPVRLEFGRRVSLEPYPKGD